MTVTVVSSGLTLGSVGVTLPVTSIGLLSVVGVSSFVMVTVVVSSGDSTVPVGVKSSPVTVYPDGGDPAGMSSSSPLGHPAAVRGQVKR